MLCRPCYSVDDTPAWVTAIWIGHNMGVSILGNGTANPHAVCILNTVKNSWWPKIICILELKVISE